MITRRFPNTNIIILLIILILTIGCIEDNESSILLNLKNDDYQKNYTLKDIEKLESYSATGGYIKTKILPDSVVISDIIEYTGIRISTLLEEITNLPDKYILNVISDDGWNITFSMNETLGNVDIYNKTGVVISNDSAVMILAYKEEDLYYSEIDPNNEIGPLRIAFIGDDVITSSNLWSRMVVSIEIIAIE